MFSTQTDYEYKIDIPLSFDVYEVIEYIDNGSSSSVIKIQNRISKQYFAAKVISKDDMKNKNLLRIVYNEIEILRSIDHPNIIKLYDSLEIQNTKGEKFIIIIEEYCKNGNLVKYLNERGFKSSNEKKQIATDLVHAIQYLHENGIAHCDVKLDNILIDDDHSAKLCDFGFSIKVANSMNATRWGTVGYNSHELYYEEIVDFIKCDIWALGITLYAMSEVELPYMNVEDAENCLVKMQTRDDQLRSVVNKCTVTDPDQRPDAKELLHEIFFSIYNDCFEVSKIDEMKANFNHKCKTNHIFMHDENDISFCSIQNLYLNGSTSLIFKHSDESKSSEYTTNSSSV